MFRTDSHFVIGRAHVEGGKPCQDYALSGISDGAAFAIVADGCSTGGKTEVGSQVLALSTAKAVREHWVTRRTTMGEDIPREIVVGQTVMMAASCAMWGLKQSDLYATCCYAYLSSSGGFVHMLGDGVVGLRKRDGSILMYRYEWEGNMPYYPAYALGEDGKFVNAHGGDVQAIRQSCERWEFVPAKGMTQLDGYSITLGAGMRGDTLFLSAEDLADIEFVAVFTDGVTQIDGLEWKEAVMRLLSFKGAMGVFAIRRMNTEIRLNLEEHKGPIDDLGYAVIHIAPPQGGAP